MASVITLESILRDINLFHEKQDVALEHMNMFLTKINTAKPIEIRKIYETIAQKIQLMDTLVSRDLGIINTAIERLENLKTKDSELTQICEEIMRETNNKKISNLKDIALENVQQGNTSNLSDIDLTILNDVLYDLQAQNIRGGKRKQNKKTKKMKKRVFSRKIKK
jgi:hypothetical protein